MRSWRVPVYPVWLKSRDEDVGPLACPPGKHVAGFFSACWQVYSFLDKMSFYNELYKHKPHDVISHEDGTLWRRQTSKLLYPLGKTERPGPVAFFLSLCLDVILTALTFSCTLPLKQFLLSTMLVDNLVHFSLIRIIRLFYLKNNSQSLQQEKWHQSALYRVRLWRLVCWGVRVKSWCVSFYMLCMLS